jgi:hypothetical protein
MLTLCAADHGFEPRLDQTKDYKIGICGFSAKHAGLRSKSERLVGLEVTKVLQLGDDYICILK